MPFYHAIIYVVIPAMLTLHSSAFAPHAIADEGGISSISQVGDANSATITQKYVASGGLSGELNSAAVTQSGINNSADITQEGNTLSATVDQNGSGNSSVIKQYGSGHNANIQQAGDGHSITVTQDNINGNAAGSPPTTLTIRQQ